LDVEMFVASSVPGRSVVQYVHCEAIQQGHGGGFTEVPERVPLVTDNTSCHSSPRWEKEIWWHCQVVTATGRGTTKRCCDVGRYAFNMFALLFTEILNIVCILVSC